MSKRACVVDHSRLKVKSLNNVEVEIPIENIHSFDFKRTYSLKIYYISCEMDNIICNHTPDNVNGSIDLIGKKIYLTRKNYTAAWSSYVAELNRRQKTISKQFAKC